MTDVEAKTPTKRCILDKEDKKGSAKKAKVTPGKQNKAANKQNNIQINQKLKKQNRTNKSENGSPKKLKPFLGTSEITAANEQAGKRSKKVTKANKGKSEQKKPRKNFFVALKDKINSKDKDAAIKSLEDKIQAIQSRDELSKTAKKKLKLLLRLKRFAEGKTVDQAEQTGAGNKSNKKKDIDVSKVQQPNIIKKIVKNQKTEVVKLNENKKAKVQNKQIVKKIKQEIKVEDESSDDEEDNLDESEVEEEEDDEGEGEEESSEEGEGEDSDEDEGEDDDGEDGEGEEEEDSDEDESEDDSPPQVEESDNKAVPSKKMKLNRSSIETESNKENGNDVNIDDLKRTNLVSTNQKRFVVFVGNIPYDTNKHDLIDHFKKCGEIKHIRIPTEKKSSKPRGFAYVEVGNEETYQRCLSMHHTFLKGRRINVLYTQGGKKKGEEKKKEIKAKNFKLHAMRKEGKLAGSKKQNQKRSFRRAKQKAIKKETESQE